MENKTNRLIPHCCVDQIFLFFPFCPSRVLSLINKQFHKASSLRSNFATHFKVVWKNLKSQPLLLTRHSQCAVKLRWDFPPDEPIFNVFKYLTNLYVEYPLRVNELHMILQHFPKLKHLRLVLESNSIKEQMKLLPNFEELEHLELDCAFSIPFEYFLLWEETNSFQSTLKTLKVECEVNVNRVDEQQINRFITIRSKFKQLRKIVWQRNYCFPVLISCLSTIDFNPNNHQSNDKTFPFVRTLNLINFSKAISNALFPNVESLHVRLLMKHHKLYWLDSLFSKVKSLDISHSTKSLNTTSCKSFKNVEELAISFQTLRKCHGTLFSPWLTLCKTLRFLEVKCHRNETSTPNSLEKIWNAKGISIHLIALETLAFTGCFNVENSFAPILPPRLKHIFLMSFSSSLQCFSRKKFQDIRFTWSNMMNPIVLSDLFNFMPFIRELTIGFMQGDLAKQIRAFQQKHCPELVLDFCI